MTENPSTDDKMADALPFDEKNAEDFFAYTRKIQEGLELIEQDPRQAVTKANLARLSGVHRNTLRHRALMACPTEHRDKTNAADFGWPYSSLMEIARARRRSATDAPQASPEQTLEDKIKQLEQQLAKSRHQVAAWFHRTVELKRERDEARRSITLLAEQQKRLKEENERLRKQNVANINSVN